MTMDDQVGKHLEDNCRVYCAVVAGTRHNLNLGDSLGVQLLLGAYLENDKKYVYLPKKHKKIQPLQHLNKVHTQGILKLNKVSGKK